MNTPDDLSPLLAKAGKAYHWASIDGEDLFQAEHLWSSPDPWRVRRKNRRGKTLLVRSWAMDQAQTLHQIFIRIRNEDTPSLVVLANQVKSRGQARGWKLRVFKHRRISTTFHIPEPEVRDMVRAALRSLLFAPLNP